MIRVIGGIVAVFVAIVALGAVRTANRSGGTDTYTPITLSSANGAPSADPTEGLRIDGMDHESTGIGDGSFYEYVTVVNDGPYTYDYLEVDADCTDAGGTVRATGFGNTVNVPPNARIVVDVIFDHAGSCTTVHASIGDAIR